MQKDISNRVIIVGAGLSGLSAADTLLQKNPNLQIIILQAMDRVGGKTYTKQIHGIKFDLGAEFIGKNQFHIIELANRAKQQFIPQIYKGTKVLYLNGQRSTYKSNIPRNVNIFALIQMQWVIWKINRMAKKVPLLDPKNCEMGNQWDSITLQTWLQKNIWSQKVKLMFTSAIRVLLGSQLNEVSFLYFLWFVHQNESFDNLVNIQDGLQQKKLRNGTQSLSFFLKEQIQNLSGKVFLNSFVKQISQNQGVIKLLTNQGKIFDCKYLILATSPSIYRKIHFTPNLSSQKRYLIQKCFMGQLTKVVVLYKRQYWKQRGFSGEIVSDSFNDPLISCFDDSKINDSGQIIQPAIIVFVGAQVYRYWKQRGDLGVKVCQKLAQAFQCDQMNQPLAVQWYQFDQEPTIGGGPVGVMGPGGLTHVKDLRKQEGNIHFAGTQMATVSVGYMDGAIESGKRAACQIWQQMQSDRMNLSNDYQIMKNELPWYNRLIRKSKKLFEWW